MNKLQNKCKLVPIPEKYLLWRHNNNSPALKTSEPGQRQSCSRDILGMRLKL